MNDEAVVPIDERRVRGAFDEFYRASYPGVLRVATAVTGDPHVAADVTQESFLAARRRWRVVGDYDRPELWVRRVAINRALSLRRRAGREARARVRFASRRDRFGPDDVVVDEVWSHVSRLPKPSGSGRTP